MPGWNAALQQGREHRNAKSAAGMSEIDDIISDFDLLGDWEDRYQYLAELGARLPPLPEAFRQEDYRVKPCMSQVWVHTYLDPDQPGRVAYHGDCDTAIIKGVLALLIGLCTGKTPAEVVALDIDHLFEGLQLAEHLSPNRHVGIYAIVEVMKGQAGKLAG